MIALIMGSAVLSGVVVIWYGHRTLVRIEAWGEKMNEIDAIYRSVAAPADMAVKVESPKGVRSGPAAVAAGPQVAVSLQR